MSFWSFDGSGSVISALKLRRRDKLKPSSVFQDSSMHPTKAVVKGLHSHAFRKSPPNVLRWDILQHQVLYFETSTSARRPRPSLRYSQPQRPQEAALELRASYYSSLRPLTEGWALLMTCPWCLVRCQTLRTRHKAQRAALPFSVLPNLLRRREDAHQPHQMQGMSGKDMTSSL